MRHEIIEAYKRVYKKQVEYKHPHTLYLAPYVDVDIKILCNGLYSDLELAVSCTIYVTRAPTIQC